MKTERIESDVLCVGGGIAGLMAAIRAREAGATVVVVEKGNTKRSGAGGGGCDHFPAYVPEAHGPSIEPFINNPPPQYSAAGLPRLWWRTLLEKSPAMVELWDSWGISMKHNGEYYFAGNVLPGETGPSWSLKYAGQDQKPILTRQAKKSGAEIMNRVMVFDLLRDGDAVIGAIGVHTREDKMIEFHARSVIVGTGVTKMLYPSSTPTWMFNRSEPPSLTGDGKAMIFRAGAELSNMHMAGRGSGPKYFPRQGKRTWVAVVRDSDGKAIGPFVTKPDK
ncbi:MAG: FAD-binding protein, partial [Deltaproteobacteria bacterium]|nr:FAD-binding protein [Deltaproteobacteria bacterium]